MSASVAPIRTRLDGQLFRITLDRPDAGNAVDLDTALALQDAIASAEASAATVIVLDAVGSVFCSGGDVAAMARASHPSAFLDRLAGAMHAALEAMTRSRLFVVAAVDGAAAGGGLGLALTADYLIATPRARFLTAYAGVGLTPDSGVSSLLARSVGMHRALALAATGRPLTADEAQRWGIVSEVVPPEQLAATVDGRARDFARAAGPALGETKRLIRAAAEATYSAQLAEEQRTIAHAAGTPHAQERIRAFLDRGAAARAESTAEPAKEQGV
ncbi:MULTISPECIES: enoyl-CoA hydratase/isomerase family protein [unclassified Microbacterium]|uniref:enoyl-CoA hydratase/isomerase family protein n=1 Tax=unclassified Microbacterium TaxID=2609290 RepID=UPI00214C4C47|nr:MULTISPECIES: enoyl-CoA hydratase/isomerase family protein [unclassified Microbacterium]MCR2783406.1 enoyl-CoA hydratase/isomerase family protein [Microbacterium sp. zg.B96]MDL5351808.1 enoyl-CoA hydratase/isomerase family protein [Microbacterium sp. zg-YB36]WIM15725.1 enoyl-CoA hydratase/isomerase family protein [Microbacterium sp. zg-B96]